MRRAGSLRWARRAGRVVGGAVLLVCGLTAGLARAEWQAPESIAAAAADFARATLAGRERVDVTAAGIDPRLKLPACAEPLVAAASSPLARGRGTISVECKAPTPWKLFVPVRVTYSVPVLVARRSLVPGQPVTAADVAVELRGSQGLPYAYLSRAADALGRTPRRTVAEGAVLNPALLDAPRLVARGRKVTLIAGSGAVRVKSDGTALEDGAANERVRVRSGSGRTIDGVVAGRDEVRVGAARALD